MLTKTISQEVIAIRAKTKLVPIVKEYVKTMRELWPDWPRNAHDFRYSDKPWVDASTKFVKGVRNTLGAQISVNVFGGSDNYSASVYSQIRLYGHSGSRWYGKADSKIYVVSDVSMHDVLTIDLDKVTVSGKLVDELVFTLNYAEALMFNKSMFTDEEVEAIIIHEFGHILNTFITLGDYVWLNYYLTDGIEILMGNKKNRYQLEILSDKAISEFVPEADRERFINDRNEENTKRVILSLAKNAPRHHLTNNKILANRREEQLADLFASRLGYGRALAMVNYKLEKHYNVALGVNWFTETLKTACMLVALPIVVLAVFLEDPVGDGQHGKYDDSLTRVIRLRRDLVMQLKSAPDVAKDSLMQDIEALDLIMKEYSSHRSVYDHLVTFFRPSIRKMEQNTLMENDLETLFNNDLFVQAAKLSKL